MDYKIIFSDNRRSVMLKIVYGDVYVRAPSRYNCEKGKKTIAEFVRSKEQWINGKLEKFRKSTENLPGILELKTFYWHGKEIFPCISESAPQTGFDGQLLTMPKRIINDNEKIVKQLKEAFRAQATAELSKKLQDRSERYGFCYSRSEIMDSRCLWGVCSAEKAIALNWRLSLLDESLCNYVILHELCHLKYMNHSPDYWKLMSDLIPDCKILRKQLQEHDFVMQYLRK